MDLPTLGAVRYPPDAGATWKQADDGGQDAVVDAFLAAWRRLDRSGERAQVRAALTDDQAGALLTYCRRRWMDGRDGAFDALSVVDLSRLGRLRAEVELTAAVTVFVTAARQRAPAEAAAPALGVAHETMAALLHDLFRRPPNIVDLGYQWVWLAYPDGVLLADRHPERPAMRDPAVLVRLAREAESQGYRVQAVTLNDDLPAVLLDAAAEDPAVAAALGEIREQSGVRCRPGWGQSRSLTAHLLRTVTVAAAATLAGAVAGRSTAHAAVVAHQVNAACVIYISDSGDPIYDGLVRTRETLSGSRSTEPGETDERQVLMPLPVPHQHIDTFLLLEVQYDGEALHQWWLAGPPPHGTHPDPVGAWQALIADGDPFRGFEVSTMDYHGPEKATVRGFWRGTWVEHRFRRNVGAGAHEWDRLRPLLQPTEFRPVRRAADQQ
ncbi:hypothetical protein AB0F81_42210 [Actinoplanes sp. NPDC024001]|uniref:hypothetical protein n=1 Tax=Actinoplanes sp. NPDC024001 TaxID=3154598 RepID=UPI0033D9D6EA